MRALFFDLENEKITLRIAENNIFIYMENRTLFSEHLITFLDEVLRKNRLKIQSIHGIVVGTLIGTFTASRAVIAAANAIAFCLNIPVLRTSGIHDLSRIMLKLRETHGGTLLRPEYMSEPSITLPRR